MLSLQKHIIICTQQFDNYWSGVGTYGTNLARGLVRTGWKVTVISPGEYSNGNDKINFISIEPSKWDFTHGGWFSLALVFSEKLKNIDADLIHFTDARESYFYKGEIPAIGTLHDYYFANHNWNPFTYKTHYVDWIKRWMYYSFVTLTERRAFRYLKFLISNSNATNEIISNNYNIPNEKIRTIYLGIDLDMNPLDEVIEKQRRENPILLFVGGNIQRKGLQTVLKSLQKLKQSYLNLQLHVIGKNQNIERIKKRSDLMGLTECVKYFGWILPQEMKKYYRRSTVFVMPSLMEGFGLVFLEAMAQGLPVIGGKTGGTVELIKNNKNGILVKPDNEKELNNAILSLLNKDKLRNNIIQNGYETVKIYQSQKMLDDTIKLYNTILEMESGN